MVPPLEIILRQKVWTKSMHENTQNTLWSYFFTMQTAGTLGIRLRKFPLCSHQKVFTGNGSHKSEAGGVTMGDWQQIKESLIVSHHIVSCKHAI